MAPSSGATAYFIHHVVLPPQLPQANDREPSYDRSLMELSLHTLEVLKSILRDENTGPVTCAIDSMKNLLRCQNNDGYIAEDQLELVLADLANGPTDAAIPLEIKEQNAGVLISRCADDIHFEFFELSPTNEAVMKKGRLIRTFPGFSSKISVFRMQDKELRASIAETLAKMATQIAEDFQHHSSRRSNHPGLVTDHFMNVIAALGESTDTLRILKHTREEVLFKECVQPWRRSPSWLLTRVSLQLLLHRNSNRLGSPDEMYKGFMVLLLSHILELATEHLEGLGSEMIYTISAKIVRRLRKMESMNQHICTESAWYDQIRTRVTAAHQLIASHWTETTNSMEADVDIESLQKLKPESDLDMLLLDLDTFLDGLNSRTSTPSSNNFRPTSEYPEFQASELPNNLSISNQYQYFRLAAMEKWVDEHLDDWVEQHQQNPATCGELRHLIEEYHSLAIEIYAGIPINMSIMYLTILEIWMRCDSLACFEFPLLREYDPEIHLEEFQCLCLPLKRHLERLHEVELHVQSRRAAAKKGNTSIFRDFGPASSFPVKYFEQSPSLKEVLSEIHRDAATKRQQKCEELKAIKREHAELMAEYYNTECEERFVGDGDGGMKRVHPRRCAHCALGRKAKALSIFVYEWPLSFDPSIARATVFELNVPETFSQWRSASIYVIANVLEFCSEAPHKLRPGATIFALDTHHDLFEMLPSHYEDQRLILSSESKANTGTPKKDVAKLEEDHVCVKNGLNYAYYDKSEKFWSREKTITGQLPEKVLHRMPKRSQALSRFLYKPPSAPDGLNFNEPLASLCEVPGHFSIDEFKAFGVAPLGRSILYHNILVQLAMPNLDFAKVETQSMILQIVYQAGSTNERIERARHDILSGEEFSNTMIDQLEVALRDRSENWESWRASATFSVLARRILSLTLSPAVVRRCLAFLRNMRGLCEDWLMLIKQRISGSTDDNQRTELHSKATEVALVYVSTYDVEEIFFDDVLESSRAVSVFIQTSISVQENLASMKLDAEGLHYIMTQSWQSLMYRIFPKLRDKLLSDTTMLNDAVRASWAGFQPTSSTIWEVLDGAQEHWLCTTSGILAVHLNLLTAELLVDGTPLTRLSSEYAQHPTYALLFQEFLMEVGPTSQAGMKFSAKSTYHGYELHFGMEGEDMLVTAVQGDTELEFLPSRLFVNLLPQSFVDDTVHWYDRQTREVVFQPRDRPWPLETDDTQWRLVRHGTLWRLVKGANVLINFASQTARTISAILSPLESPKHIHMVLDSTAQTSSLSVGIELPRLQISFEFNHTDSCLHSRQYRGMRIDPDQSMGTLVGLRSKLILRSAECRMILVPEGSVAYTKTSATDHTLVTIEEDSAVRIRAYQVDETLGRIIGDGSLRSHLILCYMHALTSHCLVDALTGYTGVESAISILRSAAVRSFDVLSEEEIVWLTLIGDLSATRLCYPQDEQIMQQISWDENLSPLVQHPQLRKSVEEIFAQARNMRRFHPESTFIPENNIPGWRHSDSYLDERDAIRSSTFRVCGFGAEAFSTEQDQEYEARDQDANSERGRRSFLAATMILRDTPALHTSVPDLKSALLGSHFANATVKGVTTTQDTLNLHYDKVWLGHSSEILAIYWCNFHHSLAKLSGKGNTFPIMFWLSAMAYAATADMVSIQALAAIYRLHNVASIALPEASTFDLSEGHDWNLEKIQATVALAAKTFTDCPEGKLPKRGSETTQQHFERTNALYRLRIEAVTAKVVASLKKKWPSDKPSTPSLPEISQYFAMDIVMPTITDMFKKWNNNRRLIAYLGRVSKMMARQEVIPILAPCYLNVPPAGVKRVKQDDRSFRASRIFAAPPATIDGISALRPAEPEIPVSEDVLTVGSAQTEVASRMKVLFVHLNHLAKSVCEKNYVKGLRESFGALRTHGSVNKVRSALLSDRVEIILRNYLETCQNHLNVLNETLRQLVQDETGFSNRLAICVQNSPRISPIFWLSYLNRDRFDLLDEAWKMVMVEYGLAITQLHRSQRLVALSFKPVELAEELGNVGHVNWEPVEHPETLLLEAECAIMVRPVQEVIAQHMRSPPDGSNTVMQLNMGEGKSSVILPMVAAALTNKQSLVRVIVAKPQSKQMLQMLISKLGGQLDRRVFHAPFSRALKFNAADADAILAMCKECVASRGILLVQPEHILSLKLMAIEYCYIGSDAAQSVLEIYRFFHNHCRDIVDESDEIFSVKLDTVYTMGSQQPVDLAPARWVVLQEILDLVKQYSHRVKNEVPRAIELQIGADGMYPRVRLLRKDAADRLVALLAHHVVEHGLVGLPTRNESTEMQQALKRYISCPDLVPEDIQAVESSKFWTASTKDIVLLVRGILAGGILRHVLSSKRWRVTYGLDTSRTPSTLLAVPYRFKDGPSPRAEFSHPDVLLILSLLSHYYGGLTDEQMFDTFRHLLKSDQANVEYNEWLRTAASDMPVAFKTLQGVNINDRMLCVQQIFPYMRYSKACIDFFLSRLVFPKEVRQFSNKISASGWDIGAVTTHPTTGFSGTCDTRFLLPLSVQHLDLPSQSHVNALVISYLLRDSSHIQLLPTRVSGIGTDASHLLTLIVSMGPEVRVILDCGAQILEQNNLQVAEAWLGMSDSRSTHAVVFFDGDELSVLDRSGRVESFQTSHFSKKLDLCNIYLDEQHTRGIDLKLPRSYRAAVTLGSGLVKDRVLQACMRMRLLGRGQTVAFVINEEIATKIRDRMGKSQSEEIDLEDMLSWTISESWIDLKKGLPIWAIQGGRFLAHENRLLEGDDIEKTKEQAAAFLEEEGQSIEARYKPRPLNNDPMAQFKDWDMTNPTVQAIIKRCQDFNVMGFTSADLEEEQEVTKIILYQLGNYANNTQRELAPEKEEERQVEHPSKMEAAQEIIHPDLQRLAKTGKLSATSTVIVPAFQALKSTSAGKLYDLPNFPTDLLVTLDFMTTIKIPTSSTDDLYLTDPFQKPVQWVISVPSNKKSGAVQNLVIISPHEANNLIATICKCAKVTLHLFSPQTNVHYRSLDALDLWKAGQNFTPNMVSRSLTMQLNLFAGSLYLRSYNEYVELCDMLGLLYTNAKEGQVVLPDGFITTSVGKWGLRDSPVPFLRALYMRVRRESEGLGKTHLGKILNGVRMEEADFVVDVRMTDDEDDSLFVQ